MVQSVPKCVPETLHSFPLMQWSYSMHASRVQIQRRWTDGVRDEHAMKHLLVCHILPQVHNPVPMKTWNGVPRAKSSAQHCAGV